MGSRSLASMLVLAGLVSATVSGRPAPPLPQSPQELESPAESSSPAQPRTEADPDVQLTPEQEEQARQLSSSIRCPVCLNLSVQDSPDELAREMKEMIRERLAAGESPEEIRQYFVDRYGEWVLLTPEPEGINLALWVLPAAVLLGGAVLLWVAVRRWTRPGNGETVVDEEEGSLAEEEATSSSESATPSTP